MEKNKLVKTIKSAQRNEESAISLLYYEYVKSVYRFAFKLTGSKEEAEDVMQNVFFIVLNKIKELRKPESFESWLNKITANCCNAVLKNRLHTVYDESFFEKQEETETRMLPEPAFDAYQVSQIVSDAVDSLPLAQRTCIYYHFYQGLTAKKIAEAIGENVHTVKSRINLAKRKIRTEITRLEREQDVKLHGIAFITPALKLSVDSVKVPSSIINNVWEGIAAETAKNAAKIAVGSTAAATSAGIRIAVLLGGLFLPVGIGIGVYLGTDIFRDVAPMPVIDVIVTENIISITEAYIPEPEIVKENILFPLELLGYNVNDNGNVFLDVDFNDPYIFLPNKFRELFFGTWEHNGSLIRINDSKECDIYFWFLSGDVAKKTEKGLVYYTLLINGGVPTVFWIDENEPDIMYVNEEFHVGNINENTFSYETWTRISSSVPEPESDYFNVMRLKEFATEHGIDPDLLIEIDSEWGQRTGTENAGWCFPAYLISEDIEKVVFKTYVRKSLGDNEVEILCTVEKINGEWVRTLEFIPNTPASEFNYETDNMLGGILITGYRGTSSVVRIPDEINGKPVKGIGFKSFNNLSFLTDIKIPYGVTFIDSDVFTDSINLLNITIPDSVTKISHRSFDGTAWLDAQSDGVVYAGRVVYTYKGDKNAETSLELSYRTKGIADGAFESFKGLTSISLPDGLEYIGNFAFSGCKLTNVTIPRSVKYTGYSAFENCTSLTDVIIEEGVTEISSGTFLGCTKLTNLSLPDSVTKITEQDFRGLINLNVTYKGVTYKPELAPSNLDELTQPINSKWDLPQSFYDIFK